MLDVESLTNKARARKYIAAKLSRGQMALFLGAGISIDVGLRSWKRLVRRCAIRVGIARHGLREQLVSGEFAEIMDEVQGRCASFDEYAALVQGALYHRISYDHSVIRSRGLVSVGSLLSGGKRGRIRTVVTLNFDDVVEHYLEVHGYVTQSVTRVPTLLRDDAIQVFHVNGYLPHPEREKRGRCSEDLVFSRESLDSRIGDVSSAWARLVQHVLDTKVCIFYGMSERTARDFALTPLLYKTKEEVYGVRATGFWLFGTQVDSGVRRMLLRYNVVPLEFGDHGNSADFLLSVCREAGVEAA